MATIKDVSQLANVSISTVSRVINNTAQVAPEARGRARGHEGLSFRPNSFAQALVTNVSNCIGVLVGDLCGGPFFAQMMRGIEHGRQGEQVHHRRLRQPRAARERHAIRALLQRQCDALILHSKALPDEELSKLASGTTPSSSSTARCRVCEGAVSGWTTQGGHHRPASICWTRATTKIAFVTSDDEGSSMASSGWPVIASPCNGRASNWINPSSVAPIADEGRLCGHERAAGARGLLHHRPGLAMPWWRGHLLPAGAGVTRSPAGVGGRFRRHPLCPLHLSQAHHGALPHRGEMGGRPWN